MRQNKYNHQHMQRSKLYALLDFGTLSGHTLHQRVDDGSAYASQTSGGTKKGENMLYVVFTESPSKIQKNKCTAALSFLLLALPKSAALCCRRLPGIPI